MLKTRNNHLKETYQNLEKTHDVKNIFNVTRKGPKLGGGWGTPKSVVMMVH